ncbi:hypothetical protein R1flu_016385 [Riccia fluitans]|uniref:5'-3' exonuclease domain-containing protein n=1 Tax=Riccia fluitans TaxID=41844 RepID=A0ABD1YLQ0_9MARC
MLIEEAGKQNVAVVEIRVLLARNRGSVLDLNVSGAGKMGHGITLQAAVHVASHAVVSASSSKTFGRTSCKVKANSGLSSGEARLLFSEDASLTFSTFFPRRRTHPNRVGIVKASTAVTKVKVPLELEDAKEPLLKVRKKKAPYKRLVKSVERIVEPTAARETCQITIDHSGSVPHKERQSYNVTDHNMAPFNKGGSSSRTLYLVDIHPLCYDGKRPRPTAVLKWMQLLFNQVTLEDPVIGVMDGEKGNDYRRQLLPGYKARRNKYKPLSGIRGPYYKGDEMDLREAFPLIRAFLSQCNVPVLKLENAEADDVVATLMHQAVKKGMRVVVASPDMDFRQLLSEDVNMLIPLPVFRRWSFYTLEQYVEQNTCDPSLDLGLRCLLGDSSDNVPGLPELAPGFGRKTALKLMKKHGSLENLLVAAKSRTVGRPYIQEALTQHADVLYRNLQVLKLRRDVDIILKDEWCRPRDRSSEAEAFQILEKNLLRRTVS